MAYDNVTNGKPTAKPSMLNPWECVCVDMVWLFKLKGNSSNSNKHIIMVDPSMGTFVIEEIPTLTQCKQDRCHQ